MTVRELIEIIHNENNFNPKDTYQDIKEILAELQENPKSVINAIEMELEDFCEKQDICETCGSNLNHGTHYECQGEYMGTDAYEGVGDIYCPYGCEQN